MTKKNMGNAPSGEAITVFTLENADGMSVSLMNLGPDILAINVPDRDGKAADVALGYPEISDYFTNGSCFGAIVGRHANRIGGAGFTLDGKTYPLEKNDNGKNNLHSGSDRWFKRVWNVDSESETSVSFSLDSADGDQGFPGNLKVTVTYTLTADNALIIDYSGLSDKKTVFNPTFHGYFNLSGEGNGDITNEILTVPADKVTWADAESIPDGRIVELDGTPMDFRTPQVIGKNIDADYDLLNFAGGYDHNYILKNDDSTRVPAFDANGLLLYRASTLEDPASGRVMEVYTDLPGIQVYTGNHLGNDVGKNGGKYPSRGGIALETQYFPNSINVPSFPQPVIEAGKMTYHRTVYKYN